MSWWAGALALLVTLPGVAWGAGDVPAAQAGRDAGAASAASADLGAIRLLVDPSARITTDENVDDHVLSVSFWRNAVDLPAQLRRVDVPGMVSFSMVAGATGSVRLDLRLADEVRAVEVVRRGREVLEIQLASRRFAGAGARVRRANEAAEAQLEGGTSDPALDALLLAPGGQSPTWVQYPPFLLPIGSAGPLRVSASWALGHLDWGSVPVVIREAWSANPVLRAAVLDAEDGRPREAHHTLASFPTPDDAARIALALARGWILSRIDPSTGFAANGPHAGDAFQLAAGLAPDAEWAAWARAHAGYHQLQELRFDEALLQLRKAAQLRPDDGERAVWEVQAGLALIGRERFEEGIEHVAAWLGAIPAREEELRFEARRGVLFALWRTGDARRASEVLDLLLSEHPALANEPARTRDWGLLLLDAGRYAEARPYFETLERTSEARVDRERARWWLHEAMAGSGNLLEARRALRRILEQTPGSSLAPLAQLRLELFDLVSAEPKERPTGWPEFAIKLQEKAALWPHTSLELEALSLTAQIWLDAEMLEEGLRLYAWVDERGGEFRGGIAFNKVLCEYAPKAFQSLRARGEAVAALGLWRRYLERPAVRACVDPELRAQAAATALASGLPELALAWLGQAVAEGQGGRDDAFHLTEIARIYLGEGRPEVARRTLRFLETAELPLDRAQVEELWGDLLMAEEKPAEALTHYDLAVLDAQRRVRGQALVPTLRFSRGRARIALGDLEGALDDLEFGLEGRGTPDPVGGWIVVAGLRQDEAEQRSDVALTPLDARGAAAWQAVADAVAKARAGETPTAEQERALLWHEASALLGRGKVKKGRKMLTELGQGTDSWALLARNQLGSLNLEGELDERTTSTGR